MYSLLQLISAFISGGLFMAIAIALWIWYECNYGDGK